MNFDLENNEWTEVENLTEGKTYILQAKTGKVKHQPTEILLAIQEVIPTKLKEGLLGKEFKFTVDNNVYVRAIKAPVNIHIQEV